MCGGRDGKTLPWLCQILVMATAVAVAVAVAVRIQCLPPARGPPQPLTAGGAKAARTMRSPTGFMVVALASVALTE